MTSNLQRAEYAAPEVQVLHLASTLSVLEVFSTDLYLEGDVEGYEFVDGY